MSEHVIKMPDIGEGIAEAELVEWFVKVGDLVREDDDLAAVMTDKATVEIPAPVDGKIAWLGAELGEMVAVGADIVRIEVGEITTKTEEQEDEEPVVAAVEEANDVTETEDVSDAQVVRMEEQTTSKATSKKVQGKALASPAVRKRARDSGIDLAALQGTGTDGQVTHSDLDAWLKDDDAQVAPSTHEDANEITDIPVIGLRRKIAEKMSIAKSHIPHITIVEEVDVTDLEGLRGKLNRSRRDDQPKLTLLPFVMMAMVKAARAYPIMNSIYDDEAGVVHQHKAVHIGMATQTSSGLMVPVIRNLERLDLWECAETIVTLSNKVRDGSGTREELSGSTITVTSLGPLGALATTPIINYPEVAIVGVNKMQVRPVWEDSKFIPRKMMNISSSFDHRVIDGWDAANFVQDLKKVLEDPRSLMRVS